MKEPRSVLANGDEDGDGYMWWDDQLIFYGSSFKSLLPIHLMRIKDYYSSTTPPSCLSKLLPADFRNIRQLKTKDDRVFREVLLKIAPCVVAVSTFSGVQRKVDCSGIIINWNEDAKEATVLTSAKIIRFAASQGVSRDDFYVVVRLADGGILLAEEDCVDYAHNVITLKVKCDQRVPFVTEVDFNLRKISEGRRVIALGRDFSSTSVLVSRGAFLSSYPYFGCEELCSSTCKITENYEGGPLINSRGDICGINFSDDGCPCANPLPMKNIVPWLKASSSTKRSWFGLSVVDSNDLPYDVLEKMKLQGLTNASILIVKQVYEDSPAERLRISPGDIILFGDRYSIATAEEIVIQKYSGWEEIMLKADKIAVDDKRFWNCWPEDSGWDGEPLSGSQTAEAYDVYMAPDLIPSVQAARAARRDSSDLEGTSCPYCPAVFECHAR